MGASVSKTQSILTGRETGVIDGEDINLFKKRT